MRTRKTLKTTLFVTFLLALWWLVAKLGVVSPLYLPRPEALAGAIMETLSDPERSARMGIAARERVAKLFQWDQAAAELVEVFEETIRAADRRSRAA